MPYILNLSPFWYQLFFVSTLFCFPYYLTNIDDARKETKETTYERYHIATEVLTSLIDFGFANAKSHTPYLL